MTMIKTVHDYTAILASLQGITPQAHVGGGACRDTVLGKAIADIDVFMDDRHVEEAAACLRANPCLRQNRRVEGIPQVLRPGDGACGQVRKSRRADPDLRRWAAALVHQPEGECRAIRLRDLPGLVRWRGDHSDRGVQPRRSANHLHAYPRRRRAAIRLLDEPLQEDHRRPLQRLDAGDPQTVQAARRKVRVQPKFLLGRRRRGLRCQKQPHEAKRAARGGQPSSESRDAA